LVPEKVSSEAAAPMFCAGFTVISGFRGTNPPENQYCAA
jgi:D-arabinose 1-dehydrogenase-like Zn-dependent alcohol dehydrogenase